MNPKGAERDGGLRIGASLRLSVYVVEQFNGLIKNHVLEGCWAKLKGITKKASMVTAGLISLNATVMDALFQGETSLKAMSHWA